MTNLKDIQDFMLSKITPITIDNDEYYDEDGHCGDGLYSDIRNFWLNFNSDKDFEYLVSGYWATDDLDLSGGRSYLLSFDELVNMCFDYMYNTLGWNKSDYKSKIWNSVEFVDEITDKYEDITVIRDEKIEKVISESTKVVDNDDYIVMKYPKSMKSKLDMLEYFEFVGFSKIDGDAVYKINIPRGKMVMTLDSYI